MDGQECNVFIGNLAWSTTSEKLYQLTREFDGLLSAEVMVHKTSNSSKGWGLLTFSDYRSAQDALETLNTVYFEGRKLFAKIDRNTEIANPAKNRVFVGNLPWDVNDEDLCNALSTTTFRPVSCSITYNTHGRSRGFGVAIFESEQDAINAIAVFHRTEFRGRIMECRLDQGRTFVESAKSSIYVGNINPQMSVDALVAIFGTVGRIVNVKIARNGSGRSKGWGIIQYESPTIAQHAANVFANAINPDNGLRFVIHIDDARTKRRNK